MNRHHNINNSPIIMDTTNSPHPGSTSGGGGLPTVFPGINVAVNPSTISATSGCQTLWLANSPPTANTTGHVYVTVDTSQNPVFAEPVLPSQPLPQALVPTQPVMEPVSASASGSVSASASAQSLVIAANNEQGNKLEALAQAASTQLPIGQQIIVNGKIFPSLSAQPLPLVTEKGDDGTLRTMVSSNDSHVCCGDCLKKFECAELFFQHWLEFHCKLDPSSAPSEEMSSTPQIDLQQCAKCNYVFEKGSDKFLKHSKNCNGDGLTPIKPVKRKNVEDINKSLSKSSKSVKRNAVANSVCCGICSINLKTITSFFLHWLQDHHQITDVLEEVWQCGQCVPNKLFSSEDRLAQHIKGDHPFKGSSVVCSVGSCNSKYLSGTSIERHLETSHGHGLCSYCKNSEKVNLAEHIKLEHESQCELCDCQILKYEMSDHLAKFHRYESVWNRNMNGLAKDPSVQHSSQPSNSVGNDSTPSMSSALGSSSATTSSVKSQQTGLSVIENNVAADKTITGSRLGSKCKACGTFFKSEKLLEKHYFANHEFQCKFCDLKMDKDVYGDHLRQHLASQRKK